MLHSNDSFLQVISASKKDNLRHFINENFSDLLKIHNDHGAVIYRGFDGDLKSDISEIAVMFGDTTFSTGEHLKLEGKNSVYSPVPYSPREELLWHNENTFNPEFPRYILFGCIKPADSGGEMTLVKSVDVLDAIPAETVKLFDQHGIKYTRQYHSDFGRSWQEVFATEDNIELEEKCAEQDLSFSWRSDGGLSTSAVLPATHKHSRLGMKAWVAQIQHWHTHFLNDNAKAFLKSMGIEDHPPKYCTLGDDTEIPSATIQQIADIYKNNELVIAMEPGDLIVLDNIQIAHGRRPYKGKRNHVVSLSGSECFN